MLLAIKFAAKIVSVLNGEVSPRQIAAGFALGAWIGLIPFGLLPTALFFFALVVNVNLAILAVATAVFKLLGFLFDPLANKLGFGLLVKTGALKGLWTALYNMPIVPYTRFNNTVVMGSFALGLILLVPLYFAARIGVEKYRTSVRPTFLNSAFMKYITASKFYGYYRTYKGIRGE